MIRLHGQQTGTWARETGLPSIEDTGAAAPGTFRECHLTLQVTRALTVNKATDAQETQAFCIE
jgi:hypothetical protein